MPDVGSSETELRRPTCLFVQVIIGPNGKSGIAPDSIYCRGRFYLSGTAQCRGTAFALKNRILYNYSPEIENNSIG